MLSEPARRTPIKPVPRPLPPPDPQRSEDVLQPLMARDKRRSGLDLFRTGGEQPEPELPPTPERPDPEMSTPPSGIHNSTPSKRASKRRGRGKKGQPTSSSPLKQPPLKATPRTEPKVSAFAKGSRKMPTTKEKIAKSSHDQQRDGHAARGVRPPDPHAEKKAERERLLAEIAELEADLSLVAAENERIRAAAETRSAPSLPPNQRDIFRLLRRRALPLETETPDAMEEWLQTAMNPVAFLPFGKASTSLAEIFTFGQSSAEEAEQKPLISHHPIPMTAAEELPFLQAFSPLAFRSALVVLPPQEQSDAPPLQKHLITATSTAHPGLFMARIEMTVHSKSLRITELGVPSMTPAAAAELQPLISRVAASGQKEAGSALVRNVTVLFWAMGEWVRVATRRAKFWCALDRLVRDKAALRDAVQQLRMRKKRKYNRRRNRGGGSGDGDNEGDDDDELSSEAPHSSGPASSYSSAELLTHLGRTAMDVDVPLQQETGGKDVGAPAVRVLWSIGFDWTGEAQSDVGILLGVPNKWRKADEQGRLAGLPKLFDQLVRGDEDPETAVKTVVGLLAGDSDTNMV